MERSSHGGRGVHGVIAEGYRADLIVENNVELKSVETLLSVHAKQVLTYIRLANPRPAIFLILVRPGARQHCLREIRMELIGML